MAERRVSPLAAAAGLAWRQAGEFVARGSAKVISLRDASYLLKMTKVPAYRPAVSPITIGMALRSAVALYGAQGAAFVLAGEWIRRSPAFHPPAPLRGYTPEVPAVDPHWDIPANYVLGATHPAGGSQFGPTAFPDVFQSPNPDIQFTMWGNTHFTGTSGAPNWNTETPTSWRANDFSFAPNGSFVIMDGVDDHPVFGPSFVQYQRWSRYDKVSGPNTAPVRDFGSPAVPAVPAVLAPMVAPVRALPQHLVRHVTQASNGLARAHSARPRARAFTSRGPAGAVKPRGKKRPPRKSKERKFIGNPRSTSFIMRLFNALTEVEDILDAAYESLPQEVKPFYAWNYGHLKRLRPYRAKEISLQQKFALVWDNLDKIELDDLAYRLFVNEIEDRVFAYAGRKGAEAVRSNKYYRSPVGLQTGPLDNVGTFRPN